LNTDTFSPFQIELLFQSIMLFTP